MSKKQPVRDTIYQLLHNGIMQGKYLPGSHLIEEQLAADFGTSRTPVREAIRRLEMESMVAYHPYRGILVTEISKDELDDLYEVRAFLEGMIAKRAALRAKEKDAVYLRQLLDSFTDNNNVEETAAYLERYHYTIMRLADCPQISETVKLVRKFLNRMLVATFIHPARNVNAQQEHHDIVTAIEHNDGCLAQELTVAHVKKAAQAAKTV